MIPADTDWLPTILVGIVSSLITAIVTYFTSRTKISADRDVAIKTEDNAHEVKEIGQVFQEWHKLVELREKRITELQLYIEEEQKQGEKWMNDLAACMAEAAADKVKIEHLERQLSKKPSDTDSVV